MAVKNRLKQIRHRLEIDTKKEFAEILKVTPSQVSLWESQKQQPNLETLIRLWQELRIYLPDLNLQDLLEYKDLLI